jgi:endonuclease/exonuclease/phosphatase (EEP) superfamily protein YafD
MKLFVYIRVKNTYKNIVKYNNMESLTVLTYNIWFDNLMLQERIISLITKIIELKPDIICLQEVREDVYNILLSNLKNYKYIHPTKITSVYGTIIMSRLPIKNCLTYPFKNSKMGRELIITNFGVVDSKKKEHIIVCATTHFESLFNKNKPNFEKLAQYDITEQILNNMYEQYGNIIFATDTNILAHEEGSFFSSGLWTDAYLMLGDDQKKFTYDGRKNVYLMLKKIPFRSRLDRILFRTDSCELIDYKLIETDGKDDVEPSDHFGVLVKFSFI